METPWWKSLARVGAGAAQGVQKASNPYGGLAQAAGNLGGAITDEEEPMADGRIVTKPTRAVIGDDGPEAVVPLGYRPDAKVRPGMAMGRRYYGE